MKTIVDYARKVKEQHALSKNLAPVEADASASSKAYAIGQHFILNGELYKAKTAIALGDALVLDTNYEAAGSIEAQIETLDAENQTLTNNVDVLIENGAVNKLPNTGTTDTRNGVTATYADNGIITLNASSPSTNATDFPISSTVKPFYLKEGTYILSGGASADARLYIRTVASTSAIAIDNGNGAEFTVTSEMASGGFAVYLHIDSGKTFNNVVVKPMVADADYTGGYVPYAMTNRELTASTLKTKLFGNIAIDSLTLAAGASGDVKKNAANISYADLGLKAGSIKAVILTWSTGHVCVPTQIYASGGNNIVLSLYNPSSSSVTVTQVDLQVFYTE